MRTRVPIFPPREYEETVMHSVQQIVFDALIIIATSGLISMKSMLRDRFYVRYFSIFVVALVELHAYVPKTCPSAAIHEVPWAHRRSAGAQVVIVTLEHVLQNEYTVSADWKHWSGCLSALRVE